MNKPTVSETKIALVIPCYNEEERFPKQDFCSLLDATSIFFCFVNDGSTDKTEQVIREITCERPESTSLISLPVNSGKGEAVRQGILHLVERGDFDVVGYWDADLSIPLEELSAFVAIFNKRDEIQSVYGCRVQRLGVYLDQFWYRQFLGRIFAAFTAFILGMAAYDTQCGAKLFRFSLAQKIFADSFFSKWFFDIELLFRMKSLYHDKTEEIVYEYPVVICRNRNQSKLKLRDFLLAPVILVRLYFLYKSTKKKNIHQMSSHKIRTKRISAVRIV